MDTERIKRRERLLHRLLEATRAGRVKWKATDLPGVFVHTANSGTFQLTGPDADRSVSVWGAGYRLLIFNGDGDVIESWTTPTVMLRMTHAMTGSDEFAGPGQLEQLYELAKTGAVRAHQVLDDLYKELGP